MISNKDHLSGFNWALNYEENELRLTSADFIKMKPCPRVAGISAQTPHWQLYNVKRQQNES